MAFEDSDISDEERRTPILYSPHKKRRRKDDDDGTTTSSGSESTGESDSDDEAGYGKHKRKTDRGEKSHGSPKTTLALGGLLLILIILAIVAFISRASLMALLDGGTSNSTSSTTPSSTSSSSSSDSASPPPSSSQASSISGSSSASLGSPEPSGTSTSSSATSTLGSSSSSCFPLNAVTFPSSGAPSATRANWWCADSQLYGFLGFSYPMEVDDCSDSTNQYAAINTDFANMKKTFGASMVRIYAPQCREVSVWENIVKACVTNGMGVIVQVWWGFADDQDLWKQTESSIYALFTTSTYASVAPYVVRNLHLTSIC